MGKTPMQDWQTALKGWEHIGTTSPKGGKSKPRLESERPYIRADMTGTSGEIIREALMDAEKEQNLKIIQGGRKNEAV